jgi:hypothetical protein
MDSKLILEAARGTLDGTLSFPGSAGVPPAVFGVAPKTFVRLTFWRGRFWWNENPA